MNKTALCCTASLLFLSLMGCSGSEQTDSDPKAKCTALVQEYYNGILSQSYEQCFGNYPDFYQAAMMNEVSASGMSQEQYIASIYSWFSETYGNDFEISLEFSDLYELSEETVQSLESAIQKSFQIEDTLETAYYMTITESVSGELSSEDTELDWYALKIDGQLYLYDRYYETE